MRNLKQMISEAKQKYKPEDGFKLPLIFEKEKTIISVEKGNYPNMKPFLQARLKSEGFKAYNTEGEELNLFTSGELIYDEDIIR